MFNNEFLEICLNSEDEEIKKLPNEIVETLKFLESIPEETNFVILDLTNFRQLIEKDGYNGMLLYWKEIDGRINFLWRMISYKSLSLLKSIVESINQKNFLPALILTRSLLENAAVFHHFLWKIIPTHNNIIKDNTIKRIINKEIEGIFISIELEELLILYSHGTTLKELTNLNEKWKQRNIGFYIQELAKNKDFSESYDYYSKLCQFAHPSIGTNIIFHNLSNSNNKIEIHTFNKNNQNIITLVENISYPLKTSCRIIRDGIKNIRDLKFVNF